MVTLYGVHATLIRLVRVTRIESFEAKEANKKACGGAVALSEGGSV
jgi:hypothetical protein